MQISSTSTQVRKQWKCLSAFFLLSLCLLLVGCGQGGGQTPTNAQGTPCSTSIQLTGAGSTFDAPLFSKMFDAYEPISCGVTVTYLGGGSAAGWNALFEQAVDFAATDIPLTDGALARSQHGAIIHIPITLGTEAIIYQVPGVSTLLKLNGPVLADIFLGKITTWNDPAITQLNPGISLPHLSITVIHRSDGSGTTGIFTQYLTQVSPEWKAAVGASYNVNWPIGEGFKGNGGVADGVQNVNGSIGYVELSYALRLHLPYVQLQNAAGNYIAPSIAGAQAAAASIQTIPPDLRFYIVNTQGVDAYPISGYSWLIVYQHQDDANKGRAIANLLWWMIHDGQSYAEPLHYAQLPAIMVAKSEMQIRSLICGNSQTPCYQT
jgi:phosphate transport system substrate-binding protein